MGECDTFSIKIISVNGLMSGMIKDYYLRTRVLCLISWTSLEYTRVLPKKPFFLIEK